MTRQYNIRFEESELRKLAELAKRSGLGRAQVLKRLIAEASESPQPVQFLKGGTGND